MTNQVKGYLDTKTNAVELVTSAYRPKDGVVNKKKCPNETSFPYVYFEKK